MAVPFIGYKKIKAFEGYVFCSIVGKLLSYFVESLVAKQNKHDIAENKLSKQETRICRDTGKIFK